MATRNFRTAKSYAVIFFWFLSPVLFVSSLAPSLSAQEGGFEENDAITLAPRAVRRQIAEAEKAIKEEKYTEAIEMLGKILMEPNDSQDAEDNELSQDYFLTFKESGLITGSVRAKASALLESLPAQQREQIELRYGVTAKQLLTDAIDSHDWAGIENVSRHYFHTLAGYEATMLLARKYLVEGRPLSAALSAERLLQSPGGSAKLGPSLALFVSSCWVEAGRSDKAIATLQAANTLFAGKKTSWSGKEYEFGPDRNWQESDLSKFPRSGLSGSIGSNWLMAGGSPQRNSDSAAALPLPTARWQVPLTRGRPDELRLQKYIENRGENAQAIFPSASAVIVGNTIVYKTIDHSLRGVDSQTGKLQWEQSLSSSQWGQSPEFFPMQMDIDVSLPDLLAERVWGDVLYWQISSDGERIYVISKPDEADANSLTPAQLRNRLQNFGTFAQKLNYLEACSVAGEGKWVWRVGGDDGEDEPLLAGAHFLGAPLPIENQLYAVAEINGETSLVVIDSETGKLLWKQQLVQTQSNNFGGGSDLSSANILLSYADGILLCPTGRGVVLAIDVASRSLRWAFRFKDTLSANVGRGGPFQQAIIQEGNALNDRLWTGVPLTIANGKVLIASSESDVLFCLDLISGEVLWSSRRDPYRYVGGVFGDKVLLIGDRVATAVNLSDGKLAWPKPLNFNASSQASGTGVRRGDRYFIPLSTDEIVELNVAEGKIVNTTRVDVPTGNLFAFREQLLSISPFGMSLFHTFEDLQKSVAAKLGTDPKDAWALARQSELLLAKNQKDEALKVLREAFTLYPENDEIRFLMITTILQSLRENFAESKDLAKEIEPLIELRPQRVSFLTALARGHLREGNQKEAIEPLMQLLELRCKDRVSSILDRSEWIELEMGHEVDLDLWIRSQLRQVYRSQSVEDRQSLDKRFFDYCSLSRNEDLVAKTRRLSYFASVPAVAPLAVELATQWINRGGGNALLEAESLLTPIALDLTSPSASLAQEKLIQLYEASDKKLAVKNLQMVVAGLAKSSADPVASLSVIPVQAASSVKWPDTETVTSLDAAENAMFRPVTTPARLLQCRSVPLAGFEVRDGSDRIVLIDPDGKESLVVNCNSSDSRLRTSEARSVRSFLVVQRKTEIAVFDTLGVYRDSRDALLWKQEMFSPEAANQRESVTMQSTPNSLGVEVYRVTSRSSNISKLGPVFDHCVIILRGNTIEARDLFTGRVLWKVEGFGPSCEVAASDDRLVVLDSTAKARRVLDAHDGHEIESQPLDGGWTTWHAWKERIVDFKSDRPATPTIEANADAMKSVTLRLWHGITGETILEKQFQADAKISLALNRYVAALESSGLLTYWDLETGKETTHQLKAIDRLKHIHLIPAYDRLLLLTDSSQYEVNDVLVEPDNNTTRTIWVNGDVYGLKIEDGQPLWSKPAEMHLINIARQQSKNSPILAFHRRLNWFDAGNQRQETTSIALMDVRDGSLIFSSDQLMLPRNESTVVESSTEPFTVLAKHGNQMIRVQWGDKAAADADVAKFGDVSLAKLIEDQRARQNKNREQGDKDAFNLFDDSDPPFPK